MKSNILLSNILSISSFFLITFYLTATVGAQTALSIDHFNDADDWPVYSPGELELDNMNVGDIRIGYHGIFGTPNGTLEAKTFIELVNVMFNGTPANWMQWTFTSETKGEKTTPNLDLLIMDKETGGLRYRMAPSKNGSKWGGPYNFIGVGNSEVKEIVISENEKATTEYTSIEGPIFDFGGLPFVLPFLELQNGKGVRLNTYQKSEINGTELIDVISMGPKEIIDTRGNSHDVTEIQTIGSSRKTRVSFYVSKSAPYFYGWDYRQVDDGTSLFKMIYKGYKLIDIES